MEIQDAYERLVTHYEMIEEINRKICEMDDKIVNFSTSFIKFPQLFSNYANKLLNLMKIPSQKITFADFQKDSELFSALLFKFVSEKIYDPFTINNSDEILKLSHSIVNIIEPLVLCQMPKLHYPPIQIPKIPTISLDKRINLQQVAQLTKPIDTNGLNFKKSVEQLENFCHELDNQIFQLTQTESTIKSQAKTTAILQAHPSADVMNNYPLYSYWKGIFDKLSKQFDQIENYQNNCQNQIKSTLSDILKISMTIQYQLSNELPNLLDNLRSLKPQYIETQLQFHKNSLIQKLLNSNNFETYLQVIQTLENIISEFYDEEKSWMLDDVKQVIEKIPMALSKMNQFKIQLTDNLKKIQQIEASEINQIENFAQKFSTKNDATVNHIQHIECTCRSKKHLIESIERSQVIIQDLKNIQQLIANYDFQPKKIDYSQMLKSEKLFLINESSLAWAQSILDHYNNEINDQKNQIKKNQETLLEIQKKSEPSSPELFKSKRDVCLKNCGHTFLKTQLEGLTQCPICHVPYVNEDIINIMWE